MATTKWVSFGTPLVFLLLFSGCMVGPDYFRPSAPIADSYTQINPDQGVVPEDCTDLAFWWGNLNDPALNQLIQTSVNQNLSVREAALRVCESRAKLGVTASSLFPQVDSDGSFYYQKRATNSGGTSIGGGIVDPTSQLWSWGTNLSWEIDVFGRLRRLVQASEADIQVNCELYHDAMLMLVSDIARNYVDARAYQERIEIVKLNIDIQAQTLRIVQARFEAQTINELDLAQAKGNLESSKAELPTLYDLYRNSLNRLSVLLGCPPGYVDEFMSEYRPIPQAPEMIAVGIPAELLRRRPDIRAAERRIAAQTYRVGAAVGDLYPMFSISGTFGLDSKFMTQFFTSESLNAGVGPAFRWNILNFGRYRCNIVANEFLAREYVVRYQQAVLTAAEEVDNALSGYVQEKQRREYLRNTVASYARAVELSQKQYEGGTVDFQRVLDSQRALLTYQNQLVQSRASVTNNIILLYRALGGGWESAEQLRYQQPTVDSAEVQAEEQDVTEQPEDQQPVDEPLNGPPPIDIN